MNYPEAYCVKCHAHTDTQNRHTLVMSNQSRAMSGYCPDCGHQVYKILPKKDAERGKNSPDAEPQPAKAALQLLTSAVGKKGAHNGITMVGPCPSCHKDRPGLFKREALNPAHQIVLIGNCKSCGHTMRKNLTDLPISLQQMTVQMLRQDRAGNTGRRKMLHRWSAWLPLTLAALALCLCLYRVSQGSF